MLALLLLGFLGVTNAMVGTTCVSTNGCDSGECCMGVSHLKGKRATSGTCTLMGKSTSDCFVQNRFFSHGMYTNMCPCASGYTCQPNGFMEIPLGMHGNCQKTRKRATSCSSGSDCGADECCVSRMRPIGKRQLLGRGVCRAMGKQASGCLVSISNMYHGKPDPMVFQCPCSAGLTCKPSGQFDMPLGAMGICTA